MPADVLYLLIFLLIFQINILPAFMPPTWLVLAFFYLQFHTQLLPLVILGACAATAGRIVLARCSSVLFRKHLPKRVQKNYASLGAYFAKHNKLTIPVVFGYAFLPIPSNQVFIAAGLAETDITLLAGSFFVGRLISYTFWVSVTSQVSENFTTLFLSHIANRNTIVLELIGLAGIYVLGLINWRKLLR